MRVVGPDPADIGGIAELKWVAEHAYMHSIMMAPHGTANGLLGLGALINVCATLPANYIAFEYPSASDPWWNDIVTGLPDGPIVNDSMVDLLPGPGLGLDIDAEAREEVSGKRTRASSTAQPAATRPASRPAFRIARRGSRRGCVGQERTLLRSLRLRFQASSSARRLGLSRALVS